MIEVIVEVGIERAPADVWAFLSDWANNPQWQKGQRSCTWTSEPPLRVGSTYDQEAVFLGRPIRSSFKVVELDPGHRVRIVTTESQLPLDITREVTADATGGSHVTAIVRGDPQGPARIFNPVTRLMVKANVSRDYGRLKVLLESS